MGIIAGITPGIAGSITVPRRDVSTDEPSAIGRINVKYYVKPLSEKGFATLREIKAVDKTEMMIFCIVWLGL